MFCNFAGTGVFFFLSLSLISPAGLAVLPLSLPGFRVSRSELGLVLVDHAPAPVTLGISQIRSLGHEVSCFLSCGLDAVSRNLFQSSSQTRQTATPAPGFQQSACC